MAGQVALSQQMIKNDIYMNQHKPNHNSNFSKHFSQCTLKVRPVTVIKSLHFSMLEVLGSNQPPSKISKVKGA